MDIHYNMPISLTLTPFDHFQNMSSGRIGPDLILTLCHIKYSQNHDDDDDDPVFFSESVTICLFFLLDLVCRLRQTWLTSPLTVELTVDLLHPGDDIATTSTRLIVRNLGEA